MLGGDPGQRHTRTGIPGPRSRTAQPPGRALLEFCRDHEPDVLRFTTDILVADQPDHRQPRC